ncbi:MAG: ATP-binding protein [bacterium]
MDKEENIKKDDYNQQKTDSPADSVFDLPPQYWKNKYENERLFWNERFKNAEQEKESLRSESTNLKSSLGNLTFRIHELENRYSEDKQLYEQKLESKIQEVENVQTQSGLERKIQQLEKRNIILRKGLMPGEVLEETELHSPSAVIALASQKIMLDLALEKEALQRKTASIKEDFEKQQKQLEAQLEEAREERHRLEEIINGKEQKLLAEKEKTKQELEKKIDESGAELALLKTRFEIEFQEQEGLSTAFSLKLHDIITEIIIYYNNLLGSRKINKSLLDELVQILTELKRVSSMLLYFLDVSTRKPLTFKEENIEHMIESIIIELKPIFRERSISIEKKYKSNIPKVILDKSSIVRAVKDILNNAVEAVIKDGKISVEISFHEKINNVCVAVTDTGVGIAKEQLDSVFKPYYTTKSHHQGLGLYNVLRTMKIHNGAVTVESDEGTVVKLYFNINQHGKNF